MGKEAGILRPGSRPGGTGRDPLGSGGRQVWEDMGRNP